MTDPMTITPAYSRDSAVAIAKSVFPTLKQATTVCIDIPLQQPAKRHAYQAVGRVAHQTFGVGNYKMKSPRGFRDMVQVTFTGGAS